MKQYITTSIFSVVTLAYLTGCGGGSGKGEDLTIPKSVIKDITENYKAIKGTTLKLDGSSSSDDIKIEKYTWLIDDNIVSDKMIYEYAIDLDIGKHEVCLEVEDKDGKKSKSCKSINIVESTLGKPTVIINNNENYKTKCPITMNGSASHAGTGGQITSYQWFIDGTQSGKKKIETFSFDTAKDYNISLKVTDNEGNTATGWKIVSIKDHDNPTAKLTILSPYQKVIFSEQNNTNTIWEVNSTTTEYEFIPYEGNLVFLSAEGSFDDCNLTDNLTYIWDARIYKDGQDTLINHCFSQKPSKANERRDFNTTGTDYESFATYKNDANYTIAKYIYPYPYENPHVDSTGHAIDLAPSKEINTPYVYIELCTGELDYNRLEIKLTVKDNLHNKKTNLTKTIEIKEANTTKNGS